MKRKRRASSRPPRWVPIELLYGPGNGEVRCPWLEAWAVHVMKCKGEAKP